MGGRRFKKIKLSKKEKKKEKKVIENKKRKIGELPGKIPIYGSDSHLINELTIESKAPFEIYDTKLNMYIKNEIKIFKKYTNNNLYTNLWE
tara:strand:+ start:47 stop:319 length:273 start_codon:yes stop_codon:yes gene_type:complete